MQELQGGNPPVGKGPEHRRGVVHCPLSHFDGPVHPLHTAVILLGPYGLVYGAMALAFGVPEARDALGRARVITRSNLREGAASFGFAASEKTHRRMEGWRETDEV